MKLLAQGYAQFPSVVSLYFRTRVRREPSLTPIWTPINLARQVVLSFRLTRGLRLRLLVSTIVLDNNAESRQEMQASVASSHCLSASFPFLRTAPADIAGTTKHAVLEALLKVSLQDTFRDASLGSSPRRHSGTCKEDTRRVVEWSSAPEGEPVLWMCGSPGIGKSIIARSCAEELALKGKLGASLFLQRRDKTERIFTSIAYQLATRSDSYCQNIGGIITKTPSLVTQTISKQFQGLIERPFLKANKRGPSSANGWVILIDGLDECGGPDVQRTIIDLITTSTRKQTTPLRWLIITRPERHIQNAFGTSKLLSSSPLLEVPVSLGSNDDIRRILVYEFENIRRKYGLSSSWPSEQEYQILLKLCAGFFICALVIARFVGTGNPEGKLRVVLSLDNRAQSVADQHSLDPLDFFYDFILTSVPQNTLSLVQKILLLRFLDDQAASCDQSRPSVGAAGYANILELSEGEYIDACASLHPLIELHCVRSTVTMKLFHSSFMEYMTDKNRSKDFCILNCRETLQWELLERLNKVHMNHPGDSINLALTWPANATGIDEHELYQRLLQTFLRLWLMFGIDARLAQTLTDFQFDKIPELQMYPAFFQYEFSPREMRKRTPREIRNKLVRRSLHPLLFIGIGKPGSLFAPRPYTLGNGKGKVVCWKAASWSGWVIAPHPSAFALL